MGDEFSISWNDIHFNCRTLAKIIVALDKPLDGIVGISRGGLFPALILSHMLNITLVDTFCVNSYYDSSRNSNDLKTLKVPDQNFNSSGKNWLIVDDLVDTGKTLQHVRKFYPDSFYCTLYAKPAGVPMVDIFVRKFSQNTWLVFPWEVT